MLSGELIGAAIEVHRVLGPGLLESAYELALERELVLRGLSVERQKPVSLEYKGALLGDGFRIDLLINDQLIVEVKAVDRIQPIHEAKYFDKTPPLIRLTGKQLGLLINFNERVLKSGLKRVANRL